MAIYEMKADGIEALTETTFSNEGIQERSDLQRILRRHIEVITPDTLVIAEEFGEWEESRRRIDLLAIDKDANLVVIELKRVEDTGHMELQAIRYAAMASTMTFDQAVKAYTKYLDSIDSEEDAQEAILSFLDWDEPDEEKFGQDVRIVLAAAEFNKELTTTVMWLNNRDLDIRCIRLKPYNQVGHLYVDVQQIIPLPEAQDYQVKVREKVQRERVARQSSRDYTKYDVTIGDVTHYKQGKGRAAYLVMRHLADSGVSPEEIANGAPWRRNRVFRCVEGHVDLNEFVKRRNADMEKEGKSNQFNPRRWFCAENELFHSDGNTYVFTNQWGPRTEEAIENWIKDCPEKDIKCVASSGHE